MLSEVVATITRLANCATKKWSNSSIADAQSSSKRLRFRNRRNWSTFFEKIPHSKRGDRDSSMTCVDPWWAETRNALIWRWIKLTLAHVAGSHTHGESSLQVERLLSIGKLQLQGWSLTTTFLEWNALAAIYISTSRELRERVAWRVLELWGVPARRGNRRLDRINLCPW